MSKPNQAGQDSDPTLPYTTHTFAISPAEAGQRLDRWLASALPDHSRSAIQRWIKDGHVLLDGSPVKASYPLEPGNSIVVTIPAPVSVPNLQAQALPLPILYEDDDLLIVDKPAGMVVHPAPGHEAGTLVNAILHHCPTLEGVGGERRPGIVHRLDKETSGLLVVAKHDRAHRYLQAQFKARTVYKEYLALLEGRIDPPQGRINAPIGRHPVERKRQAILPADPVTGETAGRQAVTDYYLQTVYTLPGQQNNTVTRFSLVRVVLHTGRTHQIRVHFAWRKHPVVGDALYGYRRSRLPIDRQFLHAHKLRLRLPSTEEEREFVAPLPADLAGVLAHLAIDA
ncbi:MAG: RluA family pseudouridine synthase [Caldilineaceae bacterium]|nr:RluA family pseudouridine synthase [Caldilineaceae bacterium]